jgi:hypothetical protein
MTVVPVARWEPGKEGLAKNGPMMLDGCTTLLLNPPAVLSMVGT